MFKAVTYYIFSLRGFRKCNTKSTILAKSLVYLTCSLVGICSINSSFEFYKGKFRKYFSTLHISKLGHNIRHVLLVSHFWNSPKPKLSNDNFVLFFPLYFSFIILSLIRWVKVLPLGRAHMHHGWCHRVIHRLISHTLMAHALRIYILMTHTLMPHRLVLPH